MTNQVRTVFNRVSLALLLTFVLESGALADGPGDSLGGRQRDLTKNLPGSVTGIYQNGVTAVTNSDGSLGINAPGRPAMVGANLSSQGGASSGTTTQPRRRQETTLALPPDPEIERLQQLASKGCTGGRDTIMWEIAVGAPDCFWCVSDPPAGNAPSNGRSDYRNNRINIAWLGEQIAESLRADPVLPPISLKANPDPGVVSVPSWFWVDPATFRGQPILLSVGATREWTEWWTESVWSEKHEPCPDDPELTCTTSTRHDVPEEAQHWDHVSVTTTLTPAAYTWHFGDDPNPAAANPPGAHVLTYTPDQGLGTPYVDIYHPSPVQWSYEADSRDFKDVGGFPITLEITWSVTYTMQFSGDTAEPSAQSGALRNRIDAFMAHHTVRQIQPLRISPSWQPGLMPTH